MADNYLSVGRPDPLQSLIQGFGAGQGIVGNINQQQMMNMKNQMLQNEMTKQEAIKNALTNYGQEGFNEAEAIKAVMPHDPELGIKIKNMQRMATKEQLEMMGAAAKLGHEMAPSLIDNPQGYHTFKMRMDSMGMGGFIPGIENFVNPQTKELDIQKMNEVAKRIGAGSQMFLEEAKANLKPPNLQHITIPGEGGSQSLGVFDPKTGQVQQIPGTTGSRFAPQLFIDKDNPENKQWISPGQTVPSNMIPQGEYKISLGKMEPAQREELLNGLESGDITPSMLSKRGGQDYNALLADAKKRGISLSKIQTQYDSARQFARTMNSQRFVNFYGYASTINNTIDRLKTLTDEMNLSGFRPLNYVDIESKMKLAGNTPEGQLATQYVTMVNGLKEEMAQVMNAGYAPTESVWKLVNEQINKNFGVNQMHSALGEVGRLINYRVQAYKELNPYQLSGANPTQPGQPNQQPENTKLKVPEAIIPKLKAVKPGETIDGGDDYLYRINPTDGLPERRKK